MVRLRGVRKDFGGLVVVPGIDLDIARGEFVVFVGPSGSGKSTLLRMVAGLELPSDGDVLIDGRDVTFDEPADRGIAMVFQSYALYPHMDVAGNMAFNLRISGHGRAEITARVQEAARVLQIQDLLGRRPSELSGGQRQRVAIGRAIVRHPKVFLFDEPLSNLDAALRVDMRLEIERLHRSLGTTMIYVTHDQVEAMTLADRIVVLDRGEIQQVGSPMELYEKPANRFVAEFIGSPRMNILPRRLAVPGAGPAETIGIRPEAMRLIEDAAGVPVGGVRLPATTQLVERLGGISFGYFRTETGEGAIVQLDAVAAPPHGSRVDLSFDPRRVHHFDAQGKTIQPAAVA
jgi:ABC-type sugar transport system ATPase subunit